MQPTIRDDLLRGAEEIALFIYGDPAKKKAVYHLASPAFKGVNRPPFFRMGATICARRSAIIAWIARQDGGSAALPEAPKMQMRRTRPAVAAANGGAK